MQRHRLLSSVPRRQFLVGSLAGFAWGWQADRRCMGCEPPFPPVRGITRGPKHHWFAYYDKLQFDSTDRYVLGMQVTFEHRSPAAEDVIKIGMVDLQDGDRWIELGQSTAWNWQQGCMLQWRPGTPDPLERPGRRSLCLSHPERADRGSTDDTTARLLGQPRRSIRSDDRLSPHRRCPPRLRVCRPARSACRRTGPGRIGYRACRFGHGPVVIDPLDR